MCTHAYASVHTYMYRHIHTCMLLLLLSRFSRVSNSVRPQKQQPTRLPRPWNSPGKNTGVGCHFLLQCMKVKSESEVAQSCLTPSDPMDCSLTVYTYTYNMCVYTCVCVCVPFYIKTWKKDWRGDIHPNVKSDYFRWKRLC